MIWICLFVPIIKNIHIGSKSTNFAYALQFFKNSTLADSLNLLNCSQNLLENYCSNVKIPDFI